MNSKMEPRHLIEHWLRSLGLQDIELSRVFFAKHTARHLNLLQVIERFCSFQEAPPPSLFSRRIPVRNPLNVMIILHSKRNKTWEMISI